MVRDLTIQESTKLARVIDIVKIIMLAHEFDTEYARLAVRKLYDQASFQDAAAVLNRSYNPDKQDLLRLQADTLKHLCDFMDGLEKCQEYKNRSSKYDSTVESINRLFL